MLRLYIKKSVENKKIRFEVIKAKILRHLEALEKEDEDIVKKSFEEMLFIAKGGRGLPVGTIREWKGKKFIKIAPGKWRPKYDSHTRGAKMAISALKKKIKACKDAHEMMQVVLENRDRFTDKNGQPLPFVQELHAFIKDYSNVSDTKISPEEASRNRSEAMKGNQNAKKDGGVQDTKANFNELSRVLETGKSSSVEHEKLGEIIIDAGSTGKSGYGLKHIIEQRYKKDGKNEDEITALLSLVLDATKDGEVVRSNERNIELEKNGIVAILRKENEERNSKWLLTGFDDWDNTEVATDAIKTVIAHNSYTPEFSSFRTQVGAVIASLEESMPESKEKSKALMTLDKKIKRAVELGFVGEWEKEDYYNDEMPRKDLLEQRVDTCLFMYERFKREKEVFKLREDVVCDFIGILYWRDGFSDYFDFLLEEKLAGKKGLSKKRLKEKGTEKIKIITELLNEHSGSPAHTELRYQGITTGGWELLENLIENYNHSLRHNKMFEQLSNVLETGKSSSVNHKDLGKIIIDAGSTGKSGYGLKHIIEQRYNKDGKNEDEIAALLTLITDALKYGDLQKNDNNFIELKKDGVMAVVSKQRHGNEENWLLTGYDLYDEEKKATDAIKTVIELYSYAPAYPGLNKQVGAVIASLEESMPESKEKSNTKKINKSVTKKYFIQVKKSVIDDTIKRLKEVCI